MSQKLHHFQKLFFVGFFSSFNKLSQSQLVPNSGFEFTRFFSFDA